MFFSGAGRLKFIFRIDLTKHSVANGSPLLRHFFERAVLPRSNDGKLGHANTLRRITAIIKKDLN